MMISLLQLLLSDDWRVGCPLLICITELGPVALLMSASVSDIAFWIVLAAKERRCGPRDRAPAMPGKCRRRFQRGALFLLSLALLFHLFFMARKWETAYSHLDRISISLADARIDPSRAIKDMQRSWR